MQNMQALEKNLEQNFKILRFVCFYYDVFYEESEIPRKKSR